MSTKIADLLASGTCVFAYGPFKVASMEYLAVNSAAIAVTDKKELKGKLKDALFSGEIRKKTAENAKALAELNHSNQQVAKRIEEIISASKTDRV